MAGALTTVSRTEDLYPPTEIHAGSVMIKHTEFVDFLRGIATGGYNLDGGLELRRALTTTEREMIRQRQKDQLPWLSPATQSEIKKVLSRVFMGFSFAPGNDDEAEQIMTQYVMVLAGMPGWAIERAAMRFAAGSVRPEEVGAKKLDASGRPSTAQLRIIVEDILQPYRDEARRISLTVKGSAVKRPPTEEERANCLAAIERWRKTSGARAQERDEIAAARHREAAEWVDQRHRDRVIHEYVEAGLDAPEEREGKMLVSLPLLLAMGWSIVDGPHGTRTLLAPPHAQTPIRARERMVL